MLQSIPVDKDIETARVGAKGFVVTANSNSYLLRFTSTKGESANDLHYASFWSCLNLLEYSLAIYL